MEISFVAAFRSLISGLNGSKIASCNYTKYPLDVYYERCLHTENKTYSLKEVANILYNTQGISFQLKAVIIEMVNKLLDSSANEDVVQVAALLLLLTNPSVACAEFRKSSAYEEYSLSYHNDDSGFFSGVSHYSMERAHAPNSYDACNNHSFSIFSAQKVSKREVKLIVEKECNLVIGLPINESIWKNLECDMIEHSVMSRAYLRSLAARHALVEELDRFTRSNLNVSSSDSLFFARTFVYKSLACYRRNCRDLAVEAFSRVEENNKSKIHIHSYRNDIRKNYDKIASIHRLMVNALQKEPERTLKHARHLKRLFHFMDSAYQNLSWSSVPLQEYIHAVEATLENRSSLFDFQEEGLNLERRPWADGIVMPTRNKLKNLEREDWAPILRDSLIAVAEVCHNLYSKSMNPEDNSRKPLKKLPAVVNLKQTSYVGSNNKIGKASPRFMDTWDKITRLYDPPVPASVLKYEQSASEIGKDLINLHKEKVRHLEKNMKKIRWNQLRLQANRIFMLKDAVAWHGHTDKHRRLDGNVTSEKELQWNEIWKIDAEMYNTAMDNVEKFHTEDNDILSADQCYKSSSGSDISCHLVHNEFVPEAHESNGDQNLRCKAEILDHETIATVASQVSTIWSNDLSISERAIEKYMNTTKAWATLTSGDFENLLIQIDMFSFWKHTTLSPLFDRHNPTAAEKTVAETRKLGLRIEILDEIYSILPRIPLVLEYIISDRFKTNLTRLSSFYFGWLAYKRSTDLALLVDRSSSKGACISIADLKLRYQLVDMGMELIYQMEHIWRPFLDRMSGELEAIIDQMINTLGRFGASAAVGEKYSLCSAVLRRLNTNNTEQ